MPIIASHCAPGGWRYRASPYQPVCAWPEDCTVQWGNEGVVIGETCSYTTAFFEAFPASPVTFIRGEGKTVEAAERSAFAQFERHRACASHDFERRRYTNGAGFCRHCGLFSSKAFPPLTRCTVCDAPTRYSCGYGAPGSADEGKAFWYCEDHADERRARGHRSAVDALLDDCLDDSEGDTSEASAGPPAASDQARA